MMVTYHENYIGPQLFLMVAFEIIFTIALYKNRTIIRGCNGTVPNLNNRSEGMFIIKLS